MPSSSSPFDSSGRSEDHPAGGPVRPVPGDLPVVVTHRRQEAAGSEAAPVAGDKTGAPIARTTDNAGQIDSSRVADRKPHPGFNEKHSLSPNAATTIDKSTIGSDLAPSMLKKDLPKVLPLHLAPIDSFFLADDRSRYPMTSIIRMEFTGSIARHAFEIALSEANERHPLTNAVIRPAKRNEPCWVKDANITPWVDWGPIDKPVKYPETEQFDLSKESGMRFWIRSDDSQTVITVQVHHACTDGTGVYRFIGDLLAVYGRQTTAAGDRSPELAEVDLRLLRGRRKRMSQLAQNGSLLDLVRHGCAQTWNIFGKRITPLAIPSESASSTPSSQSPGSGADDEQMLTPFPGVVSLQFNKEEHKLLREAAAGHGAMLNDLLMAEMFRTISRWNGAHKAARKNGWLRIMMPSDLREQQDYAMPATNMTAYTFVTRRKAECADLKQLMQSVREETGRIKHDQLGRKFMDTVEFANGGPSILKYMLSRDRCIATTILSNVGDPSKRFTASFPRNKGRIVAGNLTLEDVSGVPPMRIRSHATLAIFSYLRKLTISVRCDPYRFHRHDAEQFLHMYADGLRGHIAERIG